MQDVYGRKNLNGRLRAKLREGKPDGGSWHSLSYHRYFENYTEYKRTDARGRSRITRTYTGPVYEQKLTRGAAVLLRLLYLSLFLIMAGVLIRVGTLARDSDHCWYLAAAELCTILCLSVLGYILLVNYLFAPEKMTSGDYRGASRDLVLASAACAAGFGADLALTLLYLLSGWISGAQGGGMAAVQAASSGTAGSAAVQAASAGTAGGGEWQAVLFFGIGMAAALLTVLLEKNVPYTVTQPEEREPDDEGTEILYR